MAGNLYQALQGILDKIRQNNEAVLFNSEEREMLRKILDNQERLGEGMLVVGALLQAMLEREISFQLVPDKKESKH